VILPDYSLSVRAVPDRFGNESFATLPRDSSGKPRSEGCQPSRGTLDLVSKHRTTAPKIRETKRCKKISRRA